MNNEKAKKKFNFFDFLIATVIVAVLAVIAYVLVFSPAQNKVVGESLTLEFSVEVAAGEASIIDIAKPGDAVTLSGKSRAIIKEVTYKPAQKLVLDQISGEYKLETIPDKFDIVATVAASATQTDKDICISNTPVKVGSKMSLEGRGFAVNGAIIDMKLLNENGEEIE